MGQLLAQPQAPSSATTAAACANQQQDTQSVLMPTAMQHTQKRTRPYESLQCCHILFLRQPAQQDNGVVGAKPQQLPERIWDPQANTQHVISHEGVCEQQHARELNDTMHDATAAAAATSSYRCQHFK